MISFIHYSDNPELVLKPREYLSFREDKPAGIWFSVEGYPDDLNWRDFLTGEEFRLDKLKYRYEITLNPKANLTTLKTPLDINNFTTIYGACLDKRINFINWKRVAKDYDGIIIAPYQWECRFDPFWYYGWDCASGCVWNIDAIESFKRIENEAEEGKSLGFNG